MSGTTSRKCSLAELNGLPAEEFVRRIGGVFEHSPWIAEMAAARRPFASLDDLLGAMTSLVSSSPPEKQTALIAAHPDLAGRLAQQGRLTAESTREQTAAGLTGVDLSVLQRIEARNTAYRERFGFPFVICARLNNVNTILDAMEQRLHHAREQEIATALDEISKIARLRLEDIVEA